MKRFLFLPGNICSLMAGLILWFFIASGAQAAIVVTGDVEPVTDPATWTMWDHPYIGLNDTGSLAITDGSSVTNGEANVGYNSGASGTVTVEGAGSTWRNSGNLTVGSSGTGMLSVISGASVSNGNAYVGYNSGSSGTVSVGGAGATWDCGRLYLGYEGTGDLNITSGGSVISYNANIANSQGSSGTLTVDGLGATWTNKYGLNLAGRLSVTNGGVVTNTYADTAFVGNAVNSSGMVTVDGPGSAWNHVDIIAIGGDGEGTLAITNGGSVTDEHGFVGDDTTSIGMVTVDGEGSTWNSRSSLVVGSRGTGMLAVTNGGAVTDETGSVGSGYGSNGTVLVDGEGSEWTNTSNLKVGSLGTGTLSITNGGAVITGDYYNTSAYIAEQSYGIGTVTVDGEGSTWTNSGENYIAYGGVGKLSITNGASVTNTTGYIAYAGYDSNVGTVTVNGEGSTWTNNGELHVGYGGTGSLSITNGGSVSAHSVTIAGTGSGMSMQSVLTVDVGTGSSLKVGTADNHWTGDISNRGTVRLVAGAGADTGSYIPMSYGTMDNTHGLFQVLGGVWDESSHTVTVADAVIAQGAGGATATIDLAENQRMLINDTGTGMSVGASFLGADTSTEISLTATILSGDDLFSLESLIAGTEEEILGAWDFSIEGYTVSSDNPVYLSILADSADALLDLAIWHFADGEWTEYDASDLAFDGTYASFVADSFSGYAVTSVSQVPVPGAMLLLASGLIGIMSIKRRMG